MIDLTPPAASAFMSALPALVARKIEAAATLVRYSDGALVHNRGDEKPGLSIVKSGSVIIGVFGYDGAFVMTSIFGRGQTFGEFTLFAGMPRTHDVVARGDTEIYQIAAAHFMRLCEVNPVIATTLLSTSLIRTHMLLEVLDAMRRLPLRERVAKVLYTFTAFSGETKLKYRQSDISLILGISRVSAHTALKQLEALDLLRLGYGEIVLSDRKRLGGWVRKHCHSTLSPELT